MLLGSEFKSYQTKTELLKVFGITILFEEAGQGPVVNYLVFKITVLTKKKYEERIQKEQKIYNGKLRNIIAWLYNLIPEFWQLKIAVLSI